VEEGVTAKMGLARTVAEWSALGLVAGAVLGAILGGSLGEVVGWLSAPLLEDVTREKLVKGDVQLAIYVGLWGAAVGTALGALVGVVIHWKRRPR
jgi:hypothetical protein